MLQVRYNAPTASASIDQRPRYERPTDGRAGQRIVAWRGVAWHEKVLAFRRSRTALVESSEKGHSLIVTGMSCRSALNYFIFCRPHLMMPFPPSSAAEMACALAPPRGAQAHGKPPAAHWPAVRLPPPLPLPSRPVRRCVAAAPHLALRPSARPSAASWTLSSRLCKGAPAPCPALSAAARPCVPSRPSFSTLHDPCQLVRAHAPLCPTSSANSLSPSVPASSPSPPTPNQP